MNTLTSGRPAMDVTCSSSRRTDDTAFEFGLRGSGTVDLGPGPFGDSGRQAQALVPTPFTRAAEPDDTRFVRRFGRGATQRGRHRVPRAVRYPVPSVPGGQTGPERVA